MRLDTYTNLLQTGSQMIGNFDDLAGRCFQNEPNIYLTALVFHCGVFPFKLVGRICGHVEITPSGSINCFPLSAR